MKSKLKYETIAIDFDGTIVSDGVFPEIGEPLPHAIRVINKIKEHGGEVAIWTCRSDGREVEVGEFLEFIGVPFDKMNEPFDRNVEVYGNGGRKILADIYIDDKSIHAQKNGIDWLEIEDLLFDEKVETIYTKEEESEWFYV